MIEEATGPGPSTLDPVLPVSLLVRSCRPPSCQHGPRCLSTQPCPRGQSSWPQGRPKLQNEITQLEVKIVHLSAGGKASDVSSTNANNPAQREVALTASGHRTSVIAEQ